MLVAVSVVLWCMVVVTTASRMAGGLINFDFTRTPTREDLPSDMAMGAAMTIGICMAATILARAIRPRATWPVLLVTAAFTVVAAAVATGSILALIVTIAFSCLVWLGGELTLILVSQSPSVVAVRIPLASGIGVGLFGLLWLVLGLMQRLDAASVLIASGLALVVLILAARQVNGIWPILSGGWNLSPPSWYETILASLSAGLVTFAFLGAFVPENISDATRQHLPIAREFWQMHGLVILESMSVSRQAIQNHVIFAVAYGFGGLTAVKLVQAAIGLISIAGVFALGWLLRGRFAALVGACVFGTMPIVLWELGHAFIDMLPVVLATSALMCVLIWQRHDRFAWLVLAGALTGIGVSTKLNMAALILAIAAGVFLVGREPWNFRDRLLSTIAYCLGALTLVPWLVHLALGTGTLPGLDAALSRMAWLTTDAHHRMAKVTTSGGTLVPAGASSPDLLGTPAEWVPFGHTPIDLLRLPWTLTFAGERFAFPVVGKGEVGIASLLLIPFGLFAGLRRSTAFLVLVALLFYVAWWLTPYQISRHLLPTLAVVAALGGSGLASVVERQNGPRWQGPLKYTALGALVFSIGLTPLFFVSGTRTHIPVALLTGAQSREAYIRSSITAAVPLLASSELLAPDTPVAFLGGMWDAPQIYTGARLIFINGNDAGATPEAVLSTLGQDGVSYIIWNRGTSPTRDSSSTIRSTPFLRQYTRILAGDQDAYLFEVLPAGDTTWGQATVTNLLDDPGLQDITGKKGPWAIEGKSAIAQGAVALSRRATLMQEVAVTPGHAYLLEAPIRCLEASGRGVLTFRWLDAQGNVIDLASEVVAPGQEITSQFLWRRAPAGAARVQAEFSMAGPSRCEFSGAALYDLN